MSSVIPAHTPTAEMLVMIYGEPDDIAGDSCLTNKQRVTSAYQTLGTYLELIVTGPGATLEPLDESWQNGEADGILSDLITDLLHLATYTGLDPEEMIRKGMRDFTAEVGLGYDE